MKKIAFFLVFVLGWIGHASAVDVNTFVSTIGNKIIYYINHKETSKYDKLALYLNIKHKIRQIEHKKPYLRRILDRIIKYTDKKLVKEELNMVPISLKYVVDGDTIRFIFKGGHKSYSLRMIGIDSPESNKKRFGYIECYGKQAKEYLKSILYNTKNKELFVEFDETQGKYDKYHRVLGYLIMVSFKKGKYNVTNLNGKEIKDGYAREYTYNKYKPYIYQKLFKSYQEYAKKHHLGLWNNNTCKGKRIPIEKVKEETNKKLLDTFLK